MLFKKRKDVHDVLIFGAGKQAYWHARLALLLKGDAIHHLNIINRSFESARMMVQKLFKSELTGDIHRPKVAIITPGHTEYQRLLKANVRGASVIFCTTPSSEPLFPPGYLTHTEGRKKGRYISAIGSYKPHMIEIHPEIIQQAVAPTHGHHHHKHAKQGGAIVVDSIEACLKEAGEVIQAGLGGGQVVELGELIMLRRDAEVRRQGGDKDCDAGGGIELGQRKRRKSQSGGKGGDAHEDDGGLRDWLERGTVIYKSVGLGLMDVVVGGDLVRLADERGVGTRIEDF